MSGKNRVVEFFALEAYNVMREKNSFELRTVTATPCDHLVEHMLIASTMLMTFSPESCMKKARLDAQNRKMMNFVEFLAKKSVCESFCAQSNANGNDIQEIAPV